MKRTLKFLHNIFIAIVITVSMLSVCMMYTSTRNANAMESQPAKLENNAFYSDFWQFWKKNYTFNVPENKRITDERTKLLANKAALSRLISNAEPYIHMITEELARRNLPIELAFLPMIESAYNPNALSTAKASGIWQIMSVTAKEYNDHPNKATSWFEPRKDIIHSTYIALNLLESLNKRFDGDWLVTLAAYNAGAGRLNGAITRNKDKSKADHFWALQLPKETMQYVPKFLALISIIKESEKYGVTLPTIDFAQSLTKIDLGKSTRLETVAKASDVPLATLKKFNSGYTKGVTNPNGPHYILVPNRYAENVKQTLAKTDNSDVTIAKRDTIFYQSTKESVDYTNTVIAMNSKYGGLGDADLNHVALAKKGSTNTATKRVTHKVKTGESLSSVAKKYNAKVSQLVALNGLSHANNIRTGTTLKIA